MELRYVVKDENTIRQVLVQKLSLSSRLIIKLKKHNQIFLNNDNDIFLDKIVKLNDKIRVNLDFIEDNSNIISTNMELDILYEDDGLLIVNKPPFIPSHPSFEHYDNTVANAIKYYYDTIGLKRKIRLINRLDKNTSGVLVISKNDYIQDKIKILSKEYIAIVIGKLEGSGVISNPISRKPNSIIERCISESGEKALTEYEVIKNLRILGEDLTLVKCILHTGRTHQIRVHMKHIGHSILGDTLYGMPSKLINRQALHAYKIKFIHPVTKKELEILAPIPSDIKNIFE